MISFAQSFPHGRLLHSFPPRQSSDPDLPPLVQPQPGNAPPFVPCHIPRKRWHGAVPGQAVLARKGCRTPPAGTGGCRCHPCHCCG